MKKMTKQSLFSAVTRPSSGSLRGMVFSLGYLGYLMRLLETGDHREQVIVAELDDPDELTVYECDDLAFGIPLKELVAMDICGSHYLNRLITSMNVAPRYSSRRH